MLFLWTQALLTVPFSFQSSSGVCLSSLCPISQHFYLYQQLSFKFYQTFLAHFITETPRVVFHRQSPACRKKLGADQGAPVAFGFISFPLFLLHSCPMTSWSLWVPSPTFQPSTRHFSLRTPLSHAVFSKRLLLLGKERSS